MSSVSGLYSPLPQSISDSDSERDLHMDSLYPSNNQGCVESDIKHKLYRLNPNKNDMQSLPKAKMIKPKMSSGRKMAFVLSLIMCFLPMVIFLWILPCDIETCPVKISNWEVEQQGVEMKGTINLFFDRFKKHFNLAILYRGDLNSEEVLKNGVISFLGNNGGVNWYFRQSVVPQQLDCSLLDFDLDGILDCLLLDEKGLKAVEVLSGQTVWHAHSHEEKTIIENLQFPIDLPDVNHDQVIELLSIYQKKNLMIICGRSGKALSNIMIKQCNEVEKLKRNNEYLLFQCSNATHVIHYTANISDIIEYYRKNIPVVNFEQVELPSAEINSYSLDGYKLNIWNDGKCPVCHCVIQLFNNQNKLIYSKSYNKSYIVKPSKFKFTSNKYNLHFLKGHTEGFIIKIWNWYERFNPKRNRDYQFNFRKDYLNDTYFGNYIIERVMLVTFNTTNYSIIEASETNITQLCSQNKSPSANCQPDVGNQEDSLLISDLDRDGSQELISFSSSFYMRDNSRLDEDPWQLISTVKMIKLESELPKLYDARQSFGILPSY
ncbi:hypothetical protein WA026_016308 [Henosepilachna vigintioctopunctata]|uniref:FAM234A/B beta-propeller domain-containing protein n=1 Tax=Henosepilachna vigintioctopunctata TaxID=420089 RepID=A0AAW1ULP6_9CUCU